MNVMNMNKEVESSNSKLVEELWVVISKKLNTTIGVVRFRSICRLWRSLLAPPPTSHNLCIRHSKYLLLQTKIYCIQPSPHDHNPTTSSPSNKGSIIKVFKNSKSSKLHLFDLFTNKRIQIEETNEKVLNLMNFRVVELFELYTQSHSENDIKLRCVSSCDVCKVCKVILFSIEDRRMVFALHNDKEIKVSNIGESEEITLKDDCGENNYFDDIIHYKGQLYVVDKMGTIFWVNAFTLKLVQFSPKNMFYYVENRHVRSNWDKRVNSNLNKKQLVEYDESLYVVDLYINDERYYKRGYFLKAAFVEVYKLDQEWGKWLQIKDLGDVSFVLGRDSNFALLAQDYYGCEGNCIYFYHESKVSCFNLKTSQPKLADNFWPSPTLFHPMSG
ncbi:F-box protein At2g26160-like [Trifolium pratense]|uniref:F-box protein At2g26160-like n=1 Tax=Trifolium pratense TaxID=57577 RepID=UPI001E6947E9|nr:F-box protein At2g26160-like [Trifolium pratense]XP_045798726.1 F-box protein At2g26160-like [Trifolium pratense]